MKDSLVKDTGLGVEGRRVWFWRVITMLLLVAPAAAGVVFFGELWWWARVTVFTCLCVAALVVHLAGIGLSLNLGERFGGWLGRSAGWNEELLGDVFEGLVAVIYLVVSAVLLFWVSGYVVALSRDGLMFG